MSTVLPSSSPAPRGPCVVGGFCAEAGGKDIRSSRCARQAGRQVRRQDICRSMARCVERAGACACACTSNPSHTWARRPTLSALSAFTGRRCLFHVHALFHDHIHNGTHASLRVGFVIALAASWLWVWRDQYLGSWSCVLQRVGSVKQVVVWYICG